MFILGAAEAMSAPRRRRHLSLHAAQEHTAALRRSHSTGNHRHGNDVNSERVFVNATMHFTLVVIVKYVISMYTLTRVLYIFQH